jgi:FtsZ-binding cell division protein ZapB
LFDQQAGCFVSRFGRKEQRYSPFGFGAERWRHEGDVSVEPFDYISVVWQRLKAQVAELQKENGQAGNDLETMTAARDALTKENEKLKAEIKNLKTRSSGKRASSRKHRRS